MRPIGERKQAGIDNTEDESAMVKRYFDRFASEAEAESGGAASIAALPDRVRRVVRGQGAGHPMMSETPTGLSVRDADLPPFEGCDMGEQFGAGQEDRCTFGPLERFAAIAAEAGHPIHPYAFMFMGTAGEPGRPIHLYKHSDTRRYINLNEAGHAYRCELADDDEMGLRCSYVAWASPADAIAACYS